MAGMSSTLRSMLALGPTNPVAVRLVQSASRRPRHFYIRATYLGVLIVTLLYALAANTPGFDEMSFRQLATAGAQAFTIVAYLQIGLIAVLAPVFMAGAIAQEANPKTWDILLSTPLSAAQIVLGALLGRLFFILALLFSSLPLFAITQYFGGVPGSSIFASYLIAACTACVVGTAAVALSVSRLVGKRAVFAFCIIVTSYFAITWTIDALIAAPGQVSYATSLNPFLALQSVLDPTGYARLDPADASAKVFGVLLARPVLSWCVLSMSFSLVLTAASAITVRIGGLGQATRKVRTRKTGARQEDDDAPSTGRVRYVGHNPIAWREASARNATPTKIVLRWTFIALGLLWGLGIVIAAHNGSLNASDFRLLLLATVGAELGVVFLIAINMAASAVAREREDGTLDLLLTTPLSQRAYLTGKLRGMIAYLLPMLAVPIGSIAIAGLWVAAGNMNLVTPAYATSPSTGVLTATLPIPLVIPEAFVSLAFTSLAFTALCVMLGLQWSLKSKGSIGATVATFAIVLLVGGAVGLCGWQAGANISYLGPVLSAANPFSCAYAAVFPANGLTDTLASPNAGLGAARVSLLIGSLVSAGIHALVVWGMLSSMIRTFDFTVRKLAGAR